MRSDDCVSLFVREGRSPTRSRPLAGADAKGIPMLQPHMLLGVVLLVAGMPLVLWGAERFTDGAIGTAIRFALSPFYVGAIVSGLDL
jgi:hypothetical protein